MNQSVLEEATYSQDHHDCVGLPAATFGSRFSYLDYKSAD